MFFYVVVLIRSIIEETCIQTMKYNYFALVYDYVDIIVFDSLSLARVQPLVSMVYVVFHIFIHTCKRSMSLSKIIIINLCIVVGACNYLPT